MSASSVPAGPYLELPLPGLIAAPEPFVGQKELAELMGVSLATIDRMVGAGMPSETWGIRFTAVPAVVGVRVGPGT